MSENPENKYETADRERKKHIDQILASRARNKIVVAGPGTGKTYLFKKVLAGKKKCLALTFVNSLVEDLSLELCGLAEVRTLHSYARGLIRDASIFPDLPQIIREDAALLLNKDVDFEKIFYERDDKNEFLPFYLGRRAYYECFGYADVIFTAVKHLENDEKSIPSYDGVGRRVPGFQQT